MSTERSAAPDPLLEAREVSAGYGDVQVLRRVSMSFAPGAVTLILGRNGAGKTTLLRCLAGLLSPLEGTVWLAGHDLTRTPAHARVRRGLALVQEGKRLFHRRTVEENLLIGGVSLALSRRRLRERCGEVYDRFPVLKDRQHQRCGALSGGQQQMVAIGQALMRKPSLLMLDEPSAGLAPAISAQVLTVLSELRDEGVGIVLVEQAAELALPHADDVFVLDIGQVIFHSGPAQVPDLSVIRGLYMQRT